MEGKASQDALLWGLVGCGGILFLVLLASCGFGMYLVGTRGLPQLAPPSHAPDAPTPNAPTPNVPAPNAPAPNVPGYPPKPPPGGGELRLRVQVSSVTGSLAGRVLTGCEVRVTAPAAPGENCRALVDCDGLRLYGGGGTGYFPCDFDAAAQSVSGNDANTTAADGDAAFTLDTSARVLRLRDDGGSPNGEYALEGTF